MPPPVWATSGMMKGLERIYDTGEGHDFIITCQGTKFKVHKPVLLMHSDVLYKMSSLDFKEGQTGKADLIDDDLNVVTEMIYFMYHVCYRMNPKFYGDFNGCLSFRIRLCAAADKYNIQHLKKAILKDVVPHITLFHPEGLAARGQVKAVLEQYPQFAVDLLLAIAKQKAKQNPRFQVVKEYEHGCVHSSSVVLMEIDEHTGGPYYCTQCGEGLTAEQWARLEWKDEATSED